MKVILTGATGFVGEGVLLECLKDKRVEKVLSISRRSCGHKHEKLEEYITPNLMDLKENDEKLDGYDAVFFCAGISSVGLNELQFRPIAYDIPMHVAKIMKDKDKMTYIFVSGAGTGSTKQMWSRVKSQTENKLRQLGFKQVFNYRPAIMKPTKNQLHLKKMDKFLGFLYPLFRLTGRGNTLAQVGRSMINATANGYVKSVIDVKDIDILSS